jgi:hypothetical protein
MSKVLMSTTKHCRAEGTKSLCVAVADRAAVEEKEHPSAAVLCLVDLSQEVCVGLVEFTEHCTHIFQPESNLRSN